MEENGQPTPRQDPGEVLPEKELMIREAKRTIRQLLRIVRRTIYVVVLIYVTAWSVRHWYYFVPAQTRSSDTHIFRLYEVFSERMLWTPQDLSWELSRTHAYVEIEDIDTGEIRRDYFVSADHARWKHFDGK